MDATDMAGKNRLDKPNQAHSVDAPIAPLFRIVHPWRRATDARSWAASMRMKLQPFIGMGRLSLLSVLLFASAPFNVAAQTNAVAKPKAPTGFYVSVAEISPTFTMKFGTNGEYQVEIGPCGPLGCLSQKGKWKWDDQREEFLLTPTAPVDLWHFDFRRFTLDKQEPDTLLWVPLHGTGNVLGVYNNIRFRRQGE